MNRIVLGICGAVAALFLACGGTPAVTPASSLQSCDFHQACPQGEICNVSQNCGINPDGGGDCGEVSGDKRCHRDCLQSQTCAPDETCTRVSLFDRHDSADGGAICE